MKNPKKIKLIAAIALVTLLMTSFMLMVLPLQAQEYENQQDNGSIPLPSGVTPDVTFKPTLGLSFRPNPVGVGQTVLVNMWMDPPVSVTRYLSDFTVTITDPTDHKQVKIVDSYQADTTAWFEFTPNIVGEWKLKFEFPGGYFPPGNYTMPSGSRAGYTESYTRSLYYEPASTQEQILIVQEEQVLSWPPSELPTDYWTRPVTPEHREWWPIIGDYPWSGPAYAGSEWEALYPNTNTYWSSSYDFIPWVQGPNTAHIVWKRLDEPDSGLVGGDNGIITESGGGDTPNIIYNGRCYGSLTKVVDGEPQSVWACYDLRTGETYWERTNVSAPTYIEYSYGTESVPGATASVGFTATFVRIADNRLQKFDPAYGDTIIDVEIPVQTRSWGYSQSSVYYMNGYVLSVQDLGGGEYRLINWTTFGSTSNFANRIVSNITWSRRDLGITSFQDWSTMKSFQGREPNTPDPPGGYPFVDLTFDNATGFRYNTRMVAYDLLTGKLLWNFTVEPSSYSPACGVADHGKVAVVMREEGALWCWYQDTGGLAWKSEPMDYPWAAQGFGAYDITSAYGLIYRQAYDGVYAFYWDNGTIAWKYEFPANPYETPYTDEEGRTVYSFNGFGEVADGKLYTYNTEHSPSQPITRGWSLHCINATTGEGIWNITGSMSPGAIADGYLTASNSYTGYMYVFGKGQSATTVTAPKTSVPIGSSVVIEGTVLDQSPAQPNTPCVSAGSMSTQMEYLHMNMPVDGIWHNETITGVDVTLTAMDTDDPMNVVDLGTVTSNGYTGKFGMEWTPTEEGFYEIYASFGPTEAYGSSSASTFISVGPAPQETQTPEPSPEQPEHPIISTEAALIIGVVVVAVVAILAYWAMKRRQ